MKRHSGSTSGPALARRSPVLFALFFLACGGESSGPTPPPPPPPAAPVVAVVELTPSNPGVFMGDTVQLTATVKDQRGSVMTGKQLIWTSDAPAIAAVDSTGRVVARASGSARISAAVENKTGTVLLTSTGPATGGAVPGSAAIGPAGGPVHATLPGGGTLELTIPAGALTNTVTVTLDPLAPPPGALASFQIFPAGLQLKQPATLVIKVSAGAKVRTTSTLVFDDGNGPVPAPSTPNVAAGTVTVPLTFLGLSAAPPSAPALRIGTLPRAASGSGSVGNVLNLTPAQLVAYADSVLRQLQRQGTVASAYAMQFAMDAIVIADPTAARSLPLLNTVFGWTSAVCGFTEFARNAFNSFGFVSDYQGLERVTGEYLGWSLAMAAMRTFQAQFSTSPGCTNPVPNAQTEILNRFQALQGPITTDLTGFVLTPSPRDSVFFKDRIGPLLGLSASLRLASFDPAAQVIEDIVRSQMDRVRVGARGECRSAPGSQEMQSRLIRALATHGTLSAVASFDEFDLEKDVELCGMDILWTLRDSTAAVVSSGRTGMSAGGVVTSSGAGALPGDGTVEIGGGLMRALLCPSPASANAEQLEFLAGPDAFTLTRVAVLNPSNQNDYLQVSSLFLSTTSLRSAAGLAAGAPGVVVVVIQRIGGACSGLFANLAHSPLATLTVTLADPCFFPVGPASAPATGGARVCQAPLAINTSSLPNGTVGAGYSQTLQASGGVGSYQWSVVTGALPPGLSLGSSTGTISGTPSSAGSFSFTVKVVSGNRSVQGSFQLTVDVPGIAGTYSGTVRIVRNGNHSPTPAIDQTAFFDEVGGVIHGNICMGFACAAQYFIEGTLNGSNLVNATVQFLNGCPSGLVVVSWPAQGTITSVNGVVTVNVIASGVECSIFQTTLTFALTRTGPLP